MVYKSKVAIAVTTYGLDWTKICLETLRESTGEPYSLILIDDMTTPTSERTLRKYQDAFAPVKVICSTTDGQRRGVSGCWNEAIKIARRDLGAEYVFIANNDVRFPQMRGAECWLSRLLNAADSMPEHGWISPFWYWTGPRAFKRFDDTVWTEMDNGVDIVENGGSGCFFLLRLRTANNLMSLEANEGKESLPGYFDAVSFPGANWEEVDYVLRLRRHGWKAAVVHSVALYHEGSQATGGSMRKEVQQEYLDGRGVFLRKHGLPDGDFRVEHGTYILDAKGKREVFDH